jgi:hypothetical protein
MPAFTQAPRLVSFRAHRSRPYITFCSLGVLTAGMAPARCVPALPRHRSGLSTPSSGRHSTLLPSLASVLSQIVLYLQALGGVLLATALTILSEHTASGYFLSPWSTWALGARDKQRPSRLASYMGYPDPRQGEGRGITGSRASRVPGWASPGEPRPRVPRAEWAPDIPGTAPGPLRENDARGRRRPPGRRYRY